MFKKMSSVLNFTENFLGGHITLGPITFYGNNAMHWGVTVVTRKWGYICFRLPFRSMGRWWPLYFYASPNATPWAATFYFGPSQCDKALAPLRRFKFGHNFSVAQYAGMLREINRFRQ